MSTFRPERLISLREAAGLSQSELGRRAQVGQSTIHRLEQGETRNPRQIFLIAQALNTTPDYLFGRTDDPSYAQFNGSFADLKELSSMMASGQISADLVELDEIDLRFGLGGTYLDGPAEVSKRQFSRAWLGQFTRAAPDHLVWATGEGDSMEPTIRSGEVILIDRSQQSPRMADGIWAIAFGEIGMIKRLRPMPDGTLQLHSDNPLIRVETASDGEVHVYGRVVAVVRRL